MLDKLFVIFDILSKSALVYTFGVFFTGAFLTILGDSNPLKYEILAGIGAIIYFVLLLICTAKETLDNHKELK